MCAMSIILVAFASVKVAFYSVTLALFSRASGLIWTKYTFKVFLYYCVFTPLSTIGGNYLVETLMWNDYVVEILSMLLNFITEFLFTRFVVYGKQIDNDKKYLEKESKKAQINSKE